MAKRARGSRRAAKPQTRETNWLIIGGISVIGAIALFALLFLTLQAQDSPEQVDESAGQPLAEYCDENPDRCITKGSADAPVTLVEISDYGCGHCKNFNLDTAGILNDLYVTPGQVRWVILPFALGVQTLPSASAAMCANEQERFFDYHHHLFELQDEPDFMTKASFQRAAEDLGLDLDSFNACIDSGRYNNTIQLNMQAASEVGLSSTPSFFINDQLVRGNQQLPVFQQIINSYLEEANAD